MDINIRKQGVLYMQKVFPKKWKRIWSIIYSGNRSSTARMEFSCKVGAANSWLEQKTMLRLSDCVRVVQTEADSCPKGYAPFLVETDKIFVFAAKASELAEWIRKLCEIAFPMQGEELSARHGTGPAQASEVCSLMSGNPVYDTWTDECSFRAMVKNTEAAERCGLHGPCVLTVGSRGLQLRRPKSGEMLFVWPYCYLRSFGMQKSIFQFEAGCRCDSGEGIFKFECEESHSLWGAFNLAIRREMLAIQSSVQRIKSCDRTGPCVAAEDSKRYGGGRTASRDHICGPKAEKEPPHCSSLPPQLKDFKRIMLDRAPPPGSNPNVDASPHPLALPLVPKFEAPRRMSLPLAMASEILTNPDVRKEGSGPAENLATAEHFGIRSRVAWDKIVEKVGSTTTLVTPDCFYTSVKKELVKEKQVCRQTANSKAQCGNHVAMAGARAAGHVTTHSNPQVRGDNWTLWARTGCPESSHRRPHVNNPGVLPSAVPPTVSKVDCSIHDTESNIYSDIL